MRIAIACPAFSEHMGYLVNTLPRYLARYGQEVHVFAGDVPFNYQINDHTAVYGSGTVGRALPPGYYAGYDGYTLHILPHRVVFGHITLQGLGKCLRQLRPDVVQVYTAAGWITLECAALKPVLRYALFTGNHNAASTFALWPLRNKPLSRARVTSIVTRVIPGRFSSTFTEKCYAATEDCGEIAWRFLGVQQQKVEVQHLGVDTDLFHLPAATESATANELRGRLGIDREETVFLYTGKLTEEKNVLILARATERVRACGMRVRTLIVGEGPQSAAIAACAGVIVHPFVRHSDLPPFYWAANVGVWPTNESTSTLDAAACGLPLIVSDGIAYRQHVTGNGIVVHQHDIDDLQAAMAKLLSPSLRHALGYAGANKMREHFSMDGVAQQRIADYTAALMRSRGNR